MQELPIKLQCIIHITYIANIGQDGYSYRQIGICVLQGGNQNQWADCQISIVSKQKNFKSCQVLQLLMNNLHFAIVLPCMYRPINNS